MLPALIRRYDEAVATARRAVTNWGTGTPRREFLHVDDMAAACLHLLEHYDGPEQVNVGTGEDVTIAEIADIVAEAVGFEGETEWDTTKPDGTPQKLLDVSTLAGIGLDGRDRAARRPRRRRSSGTASTSGPCARPAEVWVAPGSGWS